MSVIILSPSKEMNRQPGHLPPTLGPLSQTIRKALSDLSLEEIAQYFKVSSDLAQTIQADIQAVEAPTAKAAYLTYQGLAFRQIDWSAISLDYAQDHLRILSAFYGVLSPRTAINPYRLDFNTRLKVADRSLKSLWQPAYQAALQGERVYNLASQEFASLLDPDQMDLITIRFYQDPDQEKKAPSATAKKLRGSLANHLLQQEDFSETTFKSFTAEGYQLVDFDPHHGHIHYAKA